MMHKKFLSRVSLLTAFVASSVAALPAQTAAMTTPKPVRAINNCDTAHPLGPLPQVIVPDLPQTGGDAKAFAPKGWAVSSEVSGDLNGDGKKDLVFILTDQDPKNIVGTQKIDTNPSIVAVAFANATGGGYTLALENSTLLCRYVASDDYGNMMQARTASLSYARGAFTVHLGPASMRGTSMATDDFVFRFQHGRFELIGYTETSTRGPDLAGSVSFNYSTHREITVTPGSRPETKVLPAALHPSIDEIGSYETWAGAPPAAPVPPPAPKPGRQTTACAGDGPTLPHVLVPDLPQTGADVNAFVPQGWKLTKQVSGDLNGDGKADVVFVLQDQDPKNVISGTNTNPRIFAVALANATGAGYTLAAENSTFLCRLLDARFIDQSGAAAISYADGAIKVGFIPFEGDMNDIEQTFTFKYQHGGLALVAYHDAERGKGSDDFNYATHTEVYDAGYGADVQTTPLPPTLMPSLDDVGAFFRWDGKATFPDPSGNP